jgi:hypothetical protein
MLIDKPSLQKTRYPIRFDLVPIEFFALTDGRVTYYSYILYVDWLKRGQSRERKKGETKPRCEV